MNILLVFGLLIITAYMTGLLLEKVNMPKTIGYIFVGIIFSPDTINFIGTEFLEAMEPIMQVSLAFIAFEVGGELRWSKVKTHKKKILSITILASLIPYLLISVGMYFFLLLFPGMITLGKNNLLILVLLLGALAAPTAPASVFAVIHQYRAQGKVTETILEVVALDDVLGILLFSLTIAGLPFIAEGTEIFSDTGTLVHPFYRIFYAIIPGAVLGFLFNPISQYLNIKKDGQWIVVIFSLILLGSGISVVLDADELLAMMTMGLVVSNTCIQQKKVFGIMKRYTENLIFLIFFLLSGLHLDVTVMPKVAPLILLFVLIRFLGKYLGVNFGARLVHADPNVRKYTFGGLLPQAGVAIGLVLSIYEERGFREISDLLLMIIIGATIINGLTGPIFAQYTLKKAGEIPSDGKNSRP